MKHKLQIISTLLLALLLHFVILTFAGPPQKINYTRIKSVECIGLDNQTIIIEFCNIKAYSRTFVTLNAKARFQRKLQQPFYVQYIMGRKTTGNFCQNVYKSDLIEFCGLMDNFEANPFIKSFINVLNDTAPQMFHKCPYEGELVIVNATVQGEKAFVLFPTGTYCVEMLIFDDKKKQFVHVRVVSDIRSGIDVMNFDMLKKKD